MNIPEIFVGSCDLIKHMVINEAEGLTSFASTFLIDEKAAINYIFQSKYIRKHVQNLTLILNVLIL